MGSNGEQPASVRGSRRVKGLCASCLRYGWTVICPMPDREPRGARMEKGAVVFCPFQWQGKTTGKMGPS